MQTDGVALSVDQYALTMVQGYLAAGMDEVAGFEFFVRPPVPQRNFLVAAGVEQVLTDLEQLHWRAAELGWVSQQPALQPPLRSWLKRFRFTGNVHALPEGTVVFPDEPLLRPCMVNGERLVAAANLQEIRDRVCEQVERLPPTLRSLHPCDAYPVRVSTGLTTLAAELDARQSGAARGQRGPKKDPEPGLASATLDGREQEVWR